MKKALLIFGIIALVGAIGFGFSVKALGVKDNNFGISFGGQKLISPISVNVGLQGDGKIKIRDGEDYEDEASKPDTTYTHEFTSGIPSDIELNIIGAQTTITCGDVEYAVLEYRIGSDNKYSLKAVLSGGRLEITEEYSTEFLNFGGGIGGGGTTLTLTLPERTYGNISVSNVGGKVNAEGFESKSLTVKMLSGDGSYSVYANDISAEMASGDLKLCNLTENKINSLEVKTLSGTVDISGFIADNTQLSSTSGKISASGLGGNVTLKSASGAAELSYAEWTGDLKIKRTSGSTDVKLPSGAGIDLDVACTSGGVSVTYDGDTDHYGDDDSDRIGGSNVHRVSVELTSGGVDIDIAK